MQTAKSGIRILGIAESFVRSAKKSVFAGVVMRKDLIIDGVSFSSATIGGTDATKTVLEIFEELCRKDIHCIMLSGCIVSWFNIIDIDEVHRKTGLPVICVTYEDSEGLEDDISRYFPGDEKRISDYRKTGIRIPFELKTGFNVYLRASGISFSDAGWLCNAYTFQGRIPEPLRVAGLMAKGAVNYCISEDFDL
ncbi:MAG: DUF99 family protein [Methanomicrobium sp.]|nr:DUF99 family protein [Methanomicrobium sp.]